MSRISPVPRTCTPVPDEGPPEHGNAGAPAREERSRRLEDFRDVSAYVLLGDPGAGKSTAFRCECAALGNERAHLITARDFLTLDPGARPETLDLAERPEWRDKTLFIDGLDEIRAGAFDARTPFDAIRARLHRLERPRFRLACRTADWLGANHRKHLKSVSPDGDITVLNLDRLTSDDVSWILRGRDGVADAEAFIASARHRGLDALLANPQSLGMLAEVVGQGHEWPESRTETFERACRLMAEETNEEHDIAGADYHVPPNDLVDAAGRLCAGLLIADRDGYARRRPGSNAQYPVLDRCVEESAGSTGLAAAARHTGPDGSARLFRRALATRLFASPDAGRFSPVHRHVAEFLAARHVARLVEDGLPVRRVLALITGSDGAVVTALRGFSGWLAALCRHSDVRQELIDRDPVGVAVYGDAAGLPTADKRRLLHAVYREASRLVEFPSPSGAGSFVTTDLEPVLREILAEPSRGREQQKFVFFVLSAAAAPLPDMSDLLLDVVREDGWYPDVRAAALEAFVRTASGGHDTAPALVALLDEVHQGIVPDPDGELRQTLLSHLFPDSVPASRVLDYLADGGDRRRFWYSLPEEVTDAEVAVLLDCLADRQGASGPAATGPSRDVMDPSRTGLNTMDLLVRGLDAHGEALDVERLYDWLGVGLVSRSYAEALAVLDAATGDVGGKPVPRVRAWLTARPETQKAVVLEGLRRPTGSGSLPAGGPDIEERLYGADPPSDLGRWCLGEALAATDPRAADYLLGRAVRAVAAGAGDAGLSIGRLRARTSGHERLRQQLARLLSSPVDSWRIERRQTWTARDARRRRRWAQEVRTQETALRENRCPPALLRPLAAAWFGLLPEITGDDGRARLGNLLEHGAGLIDAVLAGLHGAPARADVPGVDEIVRTTAAGEEFHLALPVLAGLAQIDEAQPDGPLPLDEQQMRSALAFHYTTPVSGTDRWYRRAVRSRPEIVADVLRRYGTAELRRGSASIAGFHALAHDEEHRAVAARAALPLLGSFPTRCRNAQVGALISLLWAALRWADRSELCGLIDKKLDAQSMNAAQRTHWLAAGLVAAPDRWRVQLEDFVASRDDRVRQLAAFFVPEEAASCLLERMEAPEHALLVRLLGPSFGPYRSHGTSGLSLALQASIYIGELTDRLAGSPDRTAGEALADLSSDPGLSAWREALVRARDEQRIVRRDASYRHPGIEQVCRTLANGPPANAGDLAALLVDRLREIAAEIRTGNTNDWRLFWNEGPHREPSAPKHENSCRDALLPRLRERLTPAVDAQPEGQYANDRRADLRVACGDFQVPVEIKKDSHRDLWSALRGQVLAHYAQDPATDGYGVYLVLWFGEKGTPPPDGPPPRNAQELETRLAESLSVAQARRIAVCVMDVGKPVAGRPVRASDASSRPSGAVPACRPERATRDPAAESSWAQPAGRDGDTSADASAPRSAAGTIGGADHRQ